jgi:predicted acyltransferase
MSATTERTTHTAAPAAHRIQSLDQLRGYAVAGMILVNFLGRYRSMPWFFRHDQEWMSYADTIAPLFLFVVGMGFRISFCRRIDRVGLWSARVQATKRYLTLVGIGIVVYWGWWWDALTDIGLAGIIALPFIEKSPRFRLGAAICYLVVYQLILSLTNYGMHMNGGPLGPMGWSVILLFGTLAYDWLAEADGRGLVFRLAAWGIGLCVLGLFLEIPWPGIKGEWKLTPRGMTASFTLFSTGISFLTFLLFYFICDVLGFRIPTLNVFGMNPLTIYIFHLLLLEYSWDAIRDFAPQDASALTASAAFVFFSSCCFAVGWKLMKDRIVIKL